MKFWPLLLVVACVPFSHVQAAPLASIDGVAITTEDFTSAFNVLPREKQFDYATEQGKNQFLTELINRQLLLQEADRRGITQNQEVLQQIRDASAQIIILHLIEKLKQEVDLSIDEARQYYLDHPDEFRIGEQLRIRHILIRPDSDNEADMAAAREKAGQVLKLIQTGVDFADLAGQISADQASAANGGDLGLLSPDQIDPALADAVATLAVGAITGPVRSSSGFHLIRLEEKQPGELPVFDFVENKARAKALAAKQTGVVSGLLNSLQNKATIELDQKQLQSIHFKSINK
jgi:parvulin-like peptidyl-prolyl isomerase